MYLLEGKVRVTVEGSVESFEIGGGDFRDLLACCGVVCNLHLILRK